MSRRFLLPWLTALVAACGASPEAERPPNIVFILADDLGWADVGFQGSTFHRTPNIDALARRGLVFSNAYAGAPLCSPSRACIQTGLAPARTHFTRNIAPRREPGEGRAGQGAAPLPVVEPESSSDLPAGAPTLAGVLARAGYRTALIGKWHIGTHPREAGFEVIVGPPRAGTLVSYFPPYFDGRVPGLSDAPPGQYITDRLTDEAVAFIEDSRDRPFFLYLAHFAPHSPFEGKPELVQAFEARVDPENRQHNATYAAMIASLDESVGRIVDTLERLGLADDTLVVFTSDNGAWEKRRASARNGPEYAITSNHPLRGGKGHLLEGGVRVPAIFAGAGVERGGESSAEPIIGMDFLPTFAALARTEIPAGLDGRDLGPLLRGAERLERDALYFHFPHQVFQSSIRCGDEKLLHSYLDGRSELYELSHDPGEAHDLAAARPARARELEGKLSAWLESVGARLPPANPAYVPGAHPAQEEADPED